MAQVMPEVAPPTVVQPSTTPAIPTPTLPPVTGVREVKPELFYLKDKDGKLLPWPNFSFEEWNRLQLLEKAGNPIPAAAVILRDDIQGEVQGNQAELTVDLKIAIKAKDKKWVRVPLRFTAAVLRESPRYQGSGEFFIEYEPEGEGYIAWIRADEGSEHQLQCKFLAKVQEFGAETRLALQTPVTTLGTLKLKVPLDRVDARCVRRADEEPLKVASAGGSSTLEMLGPTGDFQIMWRRATAAAAAPRQVLEATTAVQIKLEGKRRVAAEARIKVRSFGAPMETFQIRLPPGMQLVAIDQPNVQLTVLEPELDAATQQLSQIISARLANKTNGPIEVSVIAEMIRVNGAAEQPIEVGGFEVLNAIKQWGVLDLLVESDLSAIWIEGSNVRRVDDPPSDTQRAMRSLARFEFDAQPFTLQVQVVPKRTRITVEPTYVMYVDRRQLRLDATLKYKVRGSKTFNVDYEFQGWTIDRVGPDSLVQSDALLTEKTSPLSIPLVSTAIPSTGEFELRVQAHRDLPIDANELACEIPRPIGSLLTPGSLVIVPADNVEVTPRSADLQGLTNDPLPSTMKLPARQQTPLFYRELGGGTPARFAARLQVRQQTVTIAATGDVRIIGQRAQIDEQFSYTIAYEPLRNLEFDVPRALWEAGQMQVMLDDVPLPATLQPDPVGEIDPERATVRVDLLSDRIGRLDLSVRYGLPLPRIDGDRPQVWPLPLVLPLLDGERKSTNTTLRVIHEGAYDIAVTGQGWTSSQRFTPQANLENAGEWTHGVGSEFLPLQLAPTQQANQGSVLIDQLWLQTWLTAAQRQDRAVLRLTTASPTLRVQLPPQVRDADLEVALDGRRTTSYVIDAEGVLTIELPRGRQTQSLTLELWYDFNNGRPAVGSLTLHAPHVLGSGAARRAYWQLVLPENEHLLFAPSELTPDMVWRWQGTHWGRVGSLSQRELEAWAGASTQAELPAATNAYLFSTFGPLPTLEVRTELRRNVLLASSGLVLVLGLALLYLPMVRHPAFLLVTGLGLVMLGANSPGVAMLAAQAAVVGLLCVLLARLLVSVLGPRSTPHRVLRTPASSGIDHRSTAAHVRSTDGGSHGTTATVPLVLTGSPLETPP